MNSIRGLPARFLVPQDVLTPGAFLQQVTTGPRDEILSLCVDRNPWAPDFSGLPFSYTVTCCRAGSVTSLRLTNVPMVLTHVLATGPDAFTLVAGVSRGRRSNGPEPRLNALVVGEDGVVQRRFRLHYGVGDVQVDTAGNLWIGYEDEATMGGSGLAREGLAGLGPELAPRFRFNSLAKQRGLPRILNVYALNVASARDGYAYYYGVRLNDPWCFTLVQLRDAKLVGARKITELEGAHAFAVDDDRLLLAGVYGDRQRLTLLDLATGESETVVAVDPEGREIRVVEDFLSLMNQRPYWGRGSILYLLDARGVWEVDLGALPMDRAQQGRCRDHSVL
ncbi:MAG TPA: hypothetical protein VFZ25_08925 [Chloroflexota bacterium]|nr:hypothetical protein [Chloroflexota bacterium]